MTTYISKATAKTLVGNGLSMASVRSTTAKLKSVVDSIKDTKPNRAVDDFELAAAVKDAGLGSKAKSALWTALGYTKASNTDGETGFMAPVTKSDLKGQLDFSRRDLATMAKGGSLTVDSLKGKSLSSIELKLVAAAKAAR